jgi:hypothetical protein
MQHLVLWPPKKGPVLESRHYRRQATAEGAGRDGEVVAEVESRSREETQRKTASRAWKSFVFPKVRLSPKAETAQRTTSAQQYVDIFVDDRVEVQSIGRSSRNPRRQ